MLLFPWTTTEGAARLLGLHNKNVPENKMLFFLLDSCFRSPDPVVAHSSSPICPSLEKPNTPSSIRKGELLLSPSAPSKIKQHLQPGWNISKVSDEMGVRRKRWTFPTCGQTNVGITSCSVSSQRFSYQKRSAKKRSAHLSQGEW